MRGGYGRAADGRLRANGAFCQGCEVRMTIGEQRRSDFWPSRLHLGDETYAAILTAAAEYVDLCAEAGEPESAVAFADWLASVARQNGIQVDHDGARTRTESGGFARARNYTHRSPDPIPYAELPRTWKR